MWEAISFSSVPGGTNLVGPMLACKQDSELRLVLVKATLSSGNEYNLTCKKYTLLKMGFNAGKLFPDIRS